MTALDDRPVIATDEQHRSEALRALHTLGQIMQRVPVGFRLPDIAIRRGVIDIMITGLGGDHEKRATVMALSEQFGFEYVEEANGGDSRNMVRASGFQGDVPVRFWQLVAPCTCGCSGGAR